MLKSWTCCAVVFFILHGLLSYQNPKSGENFYLIYPGVYAYVVSRFFINEENEEWFPVHCVNKGLLFPVYY